MGMGADEKTVKTKRLIDADDPVLRGRLYTYTRYSGIDEAPNEYAVQELDFAPTVEERKKGKWESFIRCFQTTYHSADTQRLFECSVCRYNTNITTKFCPNCGADMRGEEDG